MAIVTKEIVKSLTGLSSDYDTIIDAYIPIVQSDIIEKTNNTFAEYRQSIQSSSITFVNASSKISLTTGGFTETAYLTNATDVNVCNSMLNNKNFTVDTVSNTEIVVDETIIEDDNPGSFIIQVSGVNYPEALQGIASSMIYTKIALNSTSNGAIKREKLDTYEIEFAENNIAGGYLKSDLEALMTYRKLSWS